MDREGSLKMPHTLGPGAFRLLLAFIVVLHHSTPLRMGAWSVYVFFILSGYWIARMWDEKYSRTRLPPLTFITSRWWRLAPIFLTCLALATLASQLFNGSNAACSTSLGWWLFQLPIVGSAWVGRILPPSWSIDVEMQFYLIAPLLCILAKTSRPFLLVILVGSLAWLFLHLASGGSAETPRGWLFLCFFCLGILIHRRNFEASARLAAISAGVFAVGCIVLLLLPATRGWLFSTGSNPLASQDVLAGRWVWAATGSFLMVPFISRNVRRRSGTVDVELGNLSYPLYLFHWIPRDWYYAHVDWSRPFWFNGLLLGGNLLGAFAGALLIRFLIDRPIDRQRGRWVRSRARKKPGAAKQSLPPHLDSASARMDASA